MKALSVGNFTRAALAAIASCFVGPLGAEAADLQTSTSSSPVVATIQDGWKISTFGYLWAAGVDGNARTLPPLPAAPVHVSFADSLKELNGGIIGAVEAINGRLILFGDLQASRSSPKQNVALNVPGVGDVEGVLSFRSATFSSLAAVGYRLIDTPGFTFDGFIGARFWYIKNTVRARLDLIAGGPSFAGELTKSESWVDGLVGARATLNVTDKMFVQAFGFVGGLSSKYEWDVFAGLGYKFNEKWTALAGYRVLQINYSRGQFVFDVTQHGPLLGVATAF